MVNFSISSTFKRFQSEAIVAAGKLLIKLSAAARGLTPQRKDKSDSGGG